MGLSQASWKEVEGRETGARGWGSGCMHSELLE